MNHHDDSHDANADARSGVAALIKSLQPVPLTGEQEPEVSLAALQALSDLGSQQALEIAANAGDPIASGSLL